MWRSATPTRGRWLLGHDGEVAPPPGPTGCTGSGTLARCGHRDKRPTTVLVRAAPRSRLIGRPLERGVHCHVRLRAFAPVATTFRKAIARSPRGPNLGPGDSRRPCVKRTFQPNNRKRKKTHGFRVRMRKRGGKAVIARRRRKGRANLSA